MSKSNKELAVDVAIEMIKANPKLIGEHNVVSQGLNLQSVVNIIKGVYQTLESLDKE